MSTPEDATEMSVKEIFKLGAHIVYPDGSGQMPCNFCKHKVEIAERMTSHCAECEQHAFVVGSNDGFEAKE